MTIGVVVPFRASGKSRLGLDDRARGALAHAMLLDVLSACLPLGTPLVVTDDRAGAELAVEIGAAVCADPGGGQGPAVAAALDRLGSGPALVVNADVPSVTSRDLRTLAAATPPHGIALVAAADGTTNALSLSSPSLFAPLYGQGSADRFCVPRSGARRRGGPGGDPAPRRRRRRPRRPATARPRRGTTDAGRPRRPRARRVNVAVLSGGVGGARFLRGLVDGDSAGRGRRDRQRRATTWRSSACTSRPTSTPSSTR